MAFIKRREPPPTLQLTEKVAQEIVAQLSDHARRYQVVVPRCMTQEDNEADLLGIRKSGFCDEFEIKLSKSDFLRDRKKVVKYRPSRITEGDDKRWFLSAHEDREGLAPWEKPKLEAMGDGDMIANYFWYVIKEGIVHATDVPCFAGLITISERGEVTVIKHPELLHRRKLSFEERFAYASLLNERFWDYRAKVL